jgi:hypothetical protein
LLLLLLLLLLREQPLQSRDPGAMELVRVGKEVQGLLTRRRIAQRLLDDDTGTGGSRGTGRS